MRIAVISDTHGQLTTARRAARLLETFAPDALLHCGDIGSPEVVEAFDRWPGHYVFGNVDRDEPGLRAAIEAAGHACHGRFGDLRLADRQIALLHGDDGPRLREAIAGGKYALVCHGHTHVVRREVVGETRVLNPGALHRAARHTLAIVDLPEMAVEILPVD